MQKSFNHSLGASLVLDQSHHVLLFIHPHSPCPLQSPSSPDSPCNSAMDGLFNFDHLALRMKGLVPQSSFATCIS